MPVLKGLDPEVKPSMGGGGLLESGVYEATMVASEIQPNYSGGGLCLATRFDVEGVDVRHWFTYSGGAEPWMAKKGQAQLARIAEITGQVWPLKTSDALHGLPLRVRIKQVESTKLKDDGTPFKNLRIVDFLPTNNAEKTKAEDVPW